MVRLARGLDGECLGVVFGSCNTPSGRGLAYSSVTLSGSRDCHLTIKTQHIRETD